jgi:hypothetical protein
MRDKLRIGKDLEGSGRGLIEVPLWHLPGSSEEKIKYFRQDVPAFLTTFEPNISQIQV